MSTPQVVVVGAGNWGRNLVKTFHSLGALGGIAEANPTLRQQISEKYPGIPIFEDYFTALAQDNTPAVVLATPASTHYTFARAALEVGRDVFVEKPITLEGEEALWLAEYADQNDRILMVGHLLLYQPAITWMRDYLASGQAGKVLHIATQRLKLGRVRSEENVWWSFAPHDISVVLELLGRPIVAGVKAQGQSMVQNRIEDYVHVDLTFKNSQSAHIHCSWYWPTVERRTTVLTDQQILVYDELTQRVTIHRQRINEKTLQHDDDGSEQVPIAHEHPLTLECQHFLHCLTTRQRPRSDGWNGVAVVNILEQAQNLLHD